MAKTFAALVFMVSLPAGTTIAPVRDNLPVCGGAIVAYRLRVG